MLPAQYSTFVAIIFALGGLFSCFAGYRLFRFVLGLNGFIAGVFVTTSIMGPASSKFAIVLAAVVGGVLGAILMVAAYFVGVALIGAALSALMLNAGWHALGRAGDPPVVVLVIVCVLGALAALSVQRYVIVIGTALSGSWMLLLGVLALVGDDAARRATTATDVQILYPLNPLPGRWWLTLVWFGVAVAGAITQLATSSGTGKTKTKKQ
jgi:hypothetical protein